MADRLKLIIADDHILFIDGLKLMLQRDPSLEVVGTATGGKELMSLLISQPADVVLMDINMPGLNGLDATKDVMGWNPNVKIILLTTYGEDYLVQKARDYGARGYLLKTSPREKLLEAIRTVAAGETFFAVGETATPVSPQHDNFAKRFNLTSREIEILQHIRQGLTTKEIGEKLFVSQFTIKTHRKNIASKLGLNNVASIMKFILDHNI